MEDIKMIVNVELDPDKLETIEHQAKRMFEFLQEKELLDEYIKWMIIKDFKITLKTKGEN